MMQLRADGVVVGRGFDASGAFVLSGTYHPPSHTEPQVRRRPRQHVHDKLTCSTMLLQVSFRFSKRYTDVAEQQGLASTHGAAASSFGVGVDGSALQLHASIDGMLSTHTQCAIGSNALTTHCVAHSLCRPCSTCWVFSCAIRRHLGCLGDSIVTCKSLSARAWWCCAPLPSCCWLHQAAILPPCMPTASCLHNHNNRYHHHCHCHYNYHLATTTT